MSNCLPFLRYFFYLGFNWNWRIALILIRLEWAGEKKYAIQTTGANNLMHVKKSGIDIAHATIYMPASYHLLEDSFKRIPATEKKHLLDIGCGRGRIVCVALYHQFKQVTGIDFSANLCKAANQNLQRVQQKLLSPSAEIICADATNYVIPDNVTTITLFNPFDEFVLRKVAAQIEASYQRMPRKIFIIYINPLHRKIFEKSGWTEEHYYLEHTYFEYSIFSKK
ncbi:MAG: hypothetical protein RLY16_1779 [Bacteroidota bacterium]